MITELRTYTIKRGMMPAWLELFAEAIVQNHALGIRIEFAGIDPNNMGTFIWARTFRDENERVELLTQLYGSEWWQRVGDHFMSHVVNYEVRLLQTAFVREGNTSIVSVFNSEGG